MTGAELKLLEELKGVNKMKRKVVNYSTVASARDNLEYIISEEIPSSMGLRSMTKSQLIDLILELEEALEDIRSSLSWARSFDVEVKE